MTHNVANRASFEHACSYLNKHCPFGQIYLKWKKRCPRTDLVKNAMYIFTASYLEHSIWRALNVAEKRRALLDHVHGDERHVAVIYTRRVTCVYCCFIVNTIVINIHSKGFKAKAELRSSVGTCLNIDRSIFSPKHTSYMSTYNIYCN